MGNIVSTNRQYDGSDLESRKFSRSFRYLEILHKTPEASRSDIKTFFGLYGDVDHINFFTSNTALVKYRNPVDARRVEEMSHMNQGLEMFGQKIVVEAIYDSEFFDVTKVNSKVQPGLHIGDLPDECLHNIFSFLPIEDILSVKEVCKRWTYLADSLTKKVKSIRHVSSERNIPTTYKLITTHWERLESLEIIFCGFEVPEEFFEVIGNNFKNLKHISFVWRNNLSLKRKRFWLKFNSFHIPDKLLKMVLALPELETVSLSNLNKMNGKALASISKTVHTIKFNRCRGLKGKNLSRVLGNVNKLIFENKTYLSDYGLIQTLYSARNVNFIAMNGYFPKVKGCIYYQIAEMKNQLRHIDFSYNYSIKLHQFMLIIYNCLLLETINISGTLCVSGTNSRIFFLYLEHFNNLQTLCINNLPIGDSTIRALGWKESLQTLEIMGNELLSCEGFSHIIKSFPNLRKLDIRFCRHVEANSLNVFSQVTHSTPLTILAQGSGIKKTEELKVPEHVTLVL